MSRNGGGPTSPLIGTFCGRNIPRTIPSHSHEMYIRLVTDYSLSGRGFRIYWDATSTGWFNNIQSIIHHADNIKQEDNAILNRLWRSSDKSRRFDCLSGLSIDLRRKCRVYLENRSFPWFTRAVCLCRSRHGKPASRMRLRLRRSKISIFFGFHLNEISCLTVS